VPTQIMLYVTNQLRETGEVKRGKTGAILGSLNATRARSFGLRIVRGAVVEDVAPGSSADFAGLKRGDILTRIHDRAVSNAGTVNATIGIAAPGTELAVVYLRDGQELRTTLTVEASTPRDVTVGAEALIGRGASVRAGSDGLVVFAVEGGSSAANAELMAGDVIRSVEGRRVTTLSALGQALGGEGQRRVVVERGDETPTLTLQ
jgi:serine protease DegQ